MADVETIVIGGGAMGTAAAVALAERSREVLLLERFHVGHDRGSSHGRSRILRFAYFEHPDYVRWVRQSERLWRALERETGRPLLHRCGGLDIGPPDGELVMGSTASCCEAGLDHELLDRRTLESRYPFTPTDPVAAVYQPDACILDPPVCLAAQREAAVSRGAVVRESTKVCSITPSANGVRVDTELETLSADRVVVTAGAWTLRLLAELGLKLEVRRKVLAFFEPSDPAVFKLGRFPIFIYESGESFFYGFPEFGGAGVKIGDHSGGEIVDPDAVDSSLREEDESHLRSFLRRHLPAADGRCLDHSTCLYTMTPDNDFIIDIHPNCDRIIFAAGFSGHGFKFAPLIGEVLADLALDGRTQESIDRFRVSRFR